MTKYVETGELVLNLGKRKRDNQFSDKMWSDVATRYQKSVERLTETSWESIMDSAWKIALDKPPGHGALASRLSGMLEWELQVDERELLVDGHEEVEDDSEMDWDQYSVEIC